MKQGEPGEKSISVACMHCSDAPCIAVCPVDALYQREDGVVLVSKKTCIGCGYCFMACPFGAPQFPKGNVFGARGAMDKCTFCAGGPEETFSKEEKQLYGQNRIAEGKVPLCAAMCATRALLAGDGSVVADVYRDRVFKRGSGVNAWGWSKAYKKS
jgi:formate dehydrogenase iron-sulfur subunit